MKKFSKAELETLEDIQDSDAFERLVVQLMQWALTTPESLRTQIIGNARRAWHEALKWERGK